MANFCSAVHELARSTLIETTTEPVVGDTVRLLCILLTLATFAPDVYGTVPLAAGSVAVKLLAPALAEAMAVVPVLLPLTRMLLVGNVCAAPHVFACPSARLATTAPVVGV